VRQLDNDVQSIYVRLADIGATQGRHTNRLDERLDGLTAGMGEFPRRLPG
jgi:hypothetical protein